MQVYKYDISLKQYFAFCLLPDDDATAAAAVRVPIHALTS